LTKGKQTALFPLPKPTATVPFWHKAANIWTKATPEQGKSRLPLQFPLILVQYRHSFLQTSRRDLGGLYFYFHFADFIVD